MEVRHGVTIVFCALALLLGVASSASTQTTLRKVTYFDFSRSVELPGDVTLSPGRYQFRIADEATARRIVQVLSEDGRSRALLLSIPAQRLDQAPDSQIRFMETTESQPPAVKSWWYVGETRGYEFVYPKEQAIRLARAVGTNVPMSESPMSTTEELKTATVTRTQLDTEPAPTEGRRAEGAMAQEAAAGRAALPQTASVLPLVGLLGALALAGAAGLRLFQ